VATILIISSIVKRLLWRASPLARGSRFYSGGQAAALFTSGYFAEDARSLSIVSSSSMLYPLILPSITSLRKTYTVAARGRCKVVRSHRTATARGGTLTR